MSTLIDYNQASNIYGMTLKMKNTKEFLNAVKAKTGAASDYALAKKLGTSKQVISNYLVKNRPMSDEIALKVASILEIDPYIVLAAVHAEHAKTEAEKNAWTVLFERLGGVAAALALGIMLNVPFDANARTGAASTLSHNANLSIHYAKRRNKKRLYNPFENLIFQLLKAA